MFTKNTWTGTVRTTALLALVSVMGALPAYAAEETIVEEVVVTGSRIKRVDLTSTSPVTVIDTAALELSASNHVATYLNELPSVGVPGSVDTATNFRTSTTGTNTINLRNLGVARTLILVNGRRHIGGLAGSPTVDVSLIPAPLVERVEVVTGGASAVYGSEAIAGVVNFVLKDDFEGIQIDGRWGDSDIGGAEEKDISLLVGGNFAEDKGNATVYAGYSKRGILNSKDRKISANDATNSSFGPKGNFFSPDFDGGGWTQDDTTGLFDKSFVAAEDGYNRNRDRIIRVPTDRGQVNTNITYQFSDKLRLFSETSYSQLTSTSNLEPSIVGQFVSVGSIPNITVPFDNPFLPAELRALILDAEPNADHAVMFRRFTEIGPRTSDIQRKTFRTLLGIDGDINDNWSFEAYWQYGNSGQDQTNGGVFNTLNFLNALNAEDDPDNVGGFRCKDTLSRDLGCIPVNVFGANTITGAALDFIQVEAQLTIRTSQTVYGATVTGDAFELPAGVVAVAFGAEYRRDKSVYNSDSLAASGLTSGNSIPNTSGKIDVTEFFVEALVPVLADLPGVDSLNLELAARSSDYSTIGKNSAYKVGFSWLPMEGLTFRGGFSTAVRAPNIDELFNPGSETFRNFSDPCALGGQGGASANLDANPYDAQSAVVQANCALIPGTATLDPRSINILSAGGLSAGNPNLQEEESETWTAGFVYSPNFVDGLNITVDYYEIEITDAISSFSAQVTADQCVRQPDFPNNPFCDLITRNPRTGLVDRINALSINSAKLNTKGVDFSADYTTDLGPGVLRVTMNGTHALEDDFLPFIGGEVIDGLEEIGSPKWKINTTLTYSWENLSVGLSTRFIDGVNVDNDNPSAGPGTISSFVYSDLQVRYVFGEEGRYETFVGVDNIFDKAPPVLGQGINGDVTGTNTASDIYDPIRRYGYVGVRFNL